MAQKLEQKILTIDARAEEAETERRMFVLQYVQPGLAGLMDGSVSTLAPLFAVCRTQYASVCMWRGAWGDAERRRIDRKGRLTPGVPGTVTGGLPESRPASHDAPGPRAASSASASRRTA